MDNKEEKVSKLVSYDVNIEKRKEDNPEILTNDFDDDIFFIKHKKTKPKKILFILLLVTIITGLIIFIITYLNKEKSFCIIGEEEKCKTCKEDNQ